MKTSTEEAFEKAVAEGKTGESTGFLGVCCDKAKRLNEFCVCAYRTICPEHGTRHWGTHD